MYLVRYVLSKPFVLGETLWIFDASEAGNDCTIGDIYIYTYIYMYIYIYAHKNGLNNS